MADPTATDEDTYIPALRFTWLTSFYDPVIALTTRERTFKSRLLEQARVEEGHEVIDIGSGTGTLAIWLKQREPGAKVTGLDGDPEILSIAKGKANRLGLPIDFKQGLSYKTPFESDRFDRCLSSLFFHHLSSENKTRTFNEIFRILKSGGELHVADWGKAKNGLMRALFYQVQLLDGFASTADNVQGLLPETMKVAGFSEVSEVDTVSTIFGTMSLYSARKP